MHKIILTTEEELEYMIRKVLTDILNPITTNSASTTIVPIQEIMNIGQASTFLSISKSGLYKHTSQRTIPHFKRGKKIYFKKHELIAWITETKKLTLDEQIVEWEKNHSKRKGR